MNQPDEIERLRRQRDALERQAVELRRLLELSERERRLIALEIHDGLAQELTGATMFVEAAQSQLPPEAKSARASLKEAGQLIRDALAEARRLMEGIRPPLLEAEGLREAMQQLIARHGEQSGIPMDVQMELRSSRLPPTLEMAVFRIVQEALTNARRHSQASRIQLRLRQDQQGLSIELSDDGVGFDPANIPTDRHGVRGIHERARWAGGEARLQSAAGKGTSLTVQLPLDDQLLTLSETPP